MEKRVVYFAMVLHFHQPVGNFTEIFERSYQRCYRPFLEYLPYYPGINITIHISGGLIDYLRMRHPELLKFIKDMVLKGQVEVLSGAYYEPILPAIPPRDIYGQITLMNKAIKDEFGIRPKGMWIPERVWSPELPRYIHNTGLLYCILDDTHMIRAGVDEKDLKGYFRTGGFFKSISVFPSSKTLRYNIPFKEPKETIDYFKRNASVCRKPIFIYADDIEKFGEWPGTYEWVYEKGWLKDFFDSLLQNKDWIKTVKVSELLRSHRAIFKVDIPEVSYEEMMEWAGGRWFNFLKRYPEAGHMFKKMRYVSSKINSLRKPVLGKNRENFYWAKIELYRGQCNCPYWHGVFGGIYMYHLRSAVYNHLIAAENLYERITRKLQKGGVCIKKFDFDNDSKDEVIIDSKFFSLYFDPKQGGTLIELDYKPLCVNLINTLSRKKERYHDEVKIKEPSLGRKLVYDKHLRYCLRDYLLREDLKREDFVSSAYEDIGSFSDGAYTVEPKKTGVILKRSGKISGVDVNIIKDVTVKDNIVEVFYKITSKINDRCEIKKNNLNFLFGVEFNLTMPFLNSSRYRYLANENVIGTLNTEGVIYNIGLFGILDSLKELDIRFEFSKSSKKLWYGPVETVNKNQIAYRSNFQCCFIFPLWQISLTEERAWSLQIKWFIG